MQVQMSTRVFAMLIAGFAAGCAPIGGLTTSSTSPRMFDLSGHNEFADSAHRASQRLQSLQVVVDEPTAVRALDGNLVLVAMSSSEITSLAGASWSDRLPRLVQARMIAALSANRQFKSVGSGDSKASADIIVASEIRAFQIEAARGSDAAHVAIDVRLIEDRTGKVIGTRLFDVSRQVGQKSTDASIAALNGTFSEVLSEVVGWSVATLDPTQRNAKSKPGDKAPPASKPNVKQPDLVTQYDPSQQ